MINLRQSILAMLLAIPLLLLPLSLFATDSIDINTADKATLMQIDGIGDAKANAIIEYRETNGPFVAVDELQEVPGIGEKTLANNRDRLSASN